MKVKTTMTMALTAVVGLILVACDNDGPAENLGEQVDDAISDTQDRLENAADEAREAADEIEDALRDE